MERRKVILGALALPVLAFIFASPFAWRYSNMILRLDRAPSLKEQRVLAAGPDRIRLSRDAESLEPGSWALQWPQGYGQVGRVISADSAGVVREFRRIVGEPPVGDWASLRGVSRSADPGSFLALPFESTAFQGPLGRYAAWFVPGRDSTWVVYVHGRGANRSEGLRTLDVLAARGLPGLLVTYRNDAGAPVSPDGFSHLGATEWRDLEAAVGFALAHGARAVVLSGYSMGGQIVMQFMSRSPLASRVRGIVLESPVLDWNATFAVRARILRIPALGTWLGKAMATARAGLDWDQLNRLHHLDGVTAPILVFHGVHDRFAPEAVSVAFARRLPGQVTLVPVEGGNHVDAWNADPARYAATMHAWFAAHGIGRNPR